MERQVALVTGASSGIGEQTALELLRRGFTVYGAARRAERMSGLTDAGGHAIAMDVTDDTSMRAAVDRIIAEQGRIDVLVNNAGYGSYGALEDVPIDEARRQFEVNVFGLARITQLVLPGMRERRSGTIVNISSIGGRIYEPLGAWYHATKFAVEGLSDSLRVEQLTDFPVYCMGVHPSAIWEVTLVGVNIPIRIGDASVMPGDAVLGTKAGVTFIPPHLLREVVETSEETRQRDVFGKMRLAEGAYTSGEIDVSTWAEHIEADYREWTKAGATR